MGERVHYAPPPQKKKPADQERMQPGAAACSTSIHLSTAFLPLFLCIFWPQECVGAYFLCPLLFLRGVSIEEGRAASKSPH